MTKTINFHRWPVWNYSFPELDVTRIVSVKYADAEGAIQDLPETEYRLTGGRNGVCGLFLLKKNKLPKLHQPERADLIAVEYEV